MEKFYSEKFCSCLPMQRNKLPSNSTYMIITVKQPVMFHQTDDETWLFNPGRRYLLNASRIPVIHDYIDSLSEFDSSTLRNPLRAGSNIHGARILVERYRERGIGDLLFLSGPLSYLHHISGASAKIDMYALSDRGVVLRHAPFLNNQTVLCGPIEYDSLQNYNYHWLVNSVTEYDEEVDQPNVYDALYKQIGFDPQDIDPQWKRPYAKLENEDFQNLDQLFHWVWTQRSIDLRRIPYYIVAPFSNATLRCMDYTNWLKVIIELGKRRPVLVVGQSNLRLPDMDMSAGAFLEKVASIGGGIINAVDATPLRVLMALTSRASATVCMDSALLYISQALRTPAISLWGTHDPRVRIGYDSAYMDMAIHHAEACNHSPCYAYSEFPVDKCPRGAQQTCCEVLRVVEPNDVLSRVDQLESDRNVFSHATSGTQAQGS